MLHHRMMMHHRKMIRSHHRMMRQLVDCSASAREAPYDELEEAPYADEFLVGASCDAP